MDADNLVKMANRIGEFFQAMPDRQEAKDGIATHIRRFWEPRMRRAIYVHLDATGGGDLMALVRESLVEQRSQLMPA